MAVTRNEFELVMSYMKRCYSEAVYPEIRCDVIFERVAGIRAEDFRRACNKLVASSRMAPMMPEFEAALSQELAEASEYSKKEKTKGLPDCMTCNNLGMQFVKDIDRPHLSAFTFQCDCPRGPILCPAYPRLQARDRINHKSDVLTDADVESIKKFKTFLNDPRASLFRRLP